MKNLIEKAEDFFFNKIAGRVLARVTVTAAGYIASKSISFGVDLDPTQVALALECGAHWIYEHFKAWRTKK